MSKDLKLRVAGIVKESIVDGPGIRLVVFAQGCPHCCKGCHNPETHDFNGGSEITVKEVLDMVNENPLLDGITLSGGEPFEQAEALATLAKEVKKLGLNVITYTGYTFEEIVEEISKNKNTSKGHLLEQTDCLIDGPFELEKRNLMLPFRGSDNQRIIDVGESLKSGKLILSN